MEESIVGQVQHRNMLIAQFMGWYKPDKRCKNPFGRLEVPEKYWELSIDYFDNFYWSAGVLKFHESWDWLMPVIIKIGQCELKYSNGASFNCYPRTFGIKGFSDERSRDNYLFRFDRFSLHSRHELILAAYDAVVEFIEWYNAKK